MSKVYKVVNDTVLIDASEHKKLSGKDLENTLNEILNVGLPIRTIDNFSTFFGGIAVLKALNEASPDLSLILAYRGIEVSVEQMAAITQYHEVVTQIKESLNAASGVGNYPLLDVPEDYKSPFKISSRGIARNGHSIGLVAAQKLWKEASTLWAQGKTGSVYSRVNWGTNCVIGNDAISIGCQSVPRLDVEQLALEMGWSFEVS